MTIRLTIEAYAKAIHMVYKDTLRAVMKIRRDSTRIGEITRLEMYRLMPSDSHLGEAVFNEAVDAKWDSLESGFVEAQVLKMIASRIERAAMREWEEGN